ncbi:MAG: Maf family protein [Thermoanaerobaculia bacterium]|nr:Maf family protein [Thermoanaerobaculia bacterium]
MPDRLILASSSPRRRELLASLGLQFEVRPVAIDESPRDGEAPARLVERLAREKARARAEPGELVVGGDTVVVLDGTVLGKPADRAEAAEMLSALAGREHEVLSGIAVVSADARQLATEIERTRVRMAPLDAERIRWYVDTGEPMDKAGSYAIQGLGATFVESIAGSYTNVVGLPLAALRRLMAGMGYELLAFRDDAGERRVESRSI